MLDTTRGRNLVRQLFTTARLPTVPFIPWICSYAAKLEQITVHEMLTDPAQLSKALQNAQRLYKYDAVINVFDPTLEAEACGCPIVWSDNYEMPSVLTHPASSFKEIAQLDISDIEKKGRLPVVLEASKRLKIVLGKEVAVIGVVTGPLTIAASLTGVNIVQELEERPAEAENLLRFAAKVSFNVCRAYCNLELDVIVIADELLPSLLAKHSDFLHSLLRPIGNIIRFHNAYPIILTKGTSLEDYKYLINMGADGVAAGVKVDLADIEMDLLQKYNCVFGVGIPSYILVRKHDEIDKYVANCLEAVANKRCFLTTEWQVPNSTPPESIHEIMNILTKPL